MERKFLVLEEWKPAHQLCSGMWNVLLNSSPLKSLLNDVAIMELLPHRAMGIGDAFAAISVMYLRFAKRDFVYALEIVQEILKQSRRPYLIIYH